MQKESLMQKISGLFRLIYTKLVKINATPHKVALGFGLGVFAGILPGTGPLAALALAFIFRANRASALLGSLLTNTWLSFVTFILAIKTGSVMLGVEWEEVYRNFIATFQRNAWLGIFKLSFLKIALPVLLGYSIIAFCCGILAYAITFIITARMKHIPKN